MATLLPETAPGCGLAGFAMLLLGLFSIGVTGVSVSTCSILSAGAQLTPERLSYGGVVDARMLEPLREVGALGPTEIPDAYHAENVAGTEACAITETRILRIGDDGVQQMPLASITAVSGTEAEVVITGETTFSCYFGEGEGGDRFLRMLEFRDR